MTAKRPPVTFELAGVNAILVTLGSQLNQHLPLFFKAVRRNLLSEHSDIITQVLPAYTSMLIEYDPRDIRMYDLQLLVERVIEETPFESPQVDSKLLEVAVIYGGSYGPDLETVAKHCQLSTDEVIALHQGRDYQVHALGFAPGFAYLGELDKKLRMPRLDTPRQQVAAGSVAIAEQQTAVYPQSSPGGWHLIGYSPQVWFDPTASSMTPVEVGDRVRFVQATEAEIKALEKGQ